MRARYTDRTKGRRVRVVTNDVKALCKIDTELTNEGFKQVGLLRFWIAVVFPVKKEKPNGS